MKINIIAIGTRMPAWVNTGVQTYCKRMPTDYQIQLREIAALKRDKHADINTILQKESDSLLSHCQSHHITIALERLGEDINTEQLATQLQNWHDLNQNIDILIGGPEGIHSHHLNKIQHKWSLSALTLAHPLVRIVIIEQLYRAYTIIQGHPYHR